MAAGYQDAAEVTLAWLRSSGHCKNMMNPDFTHIGTAHFVDASFGFSKPNGSLMRYRDSYVQVFFRH